MNNHEIVQEEPNQADKAKLRGQIVRRLWAGEIIKFIYNESSNHEAIDEIIYIADAIGQQDLGLFSESLIHIWKPKKNEKTTIK